jgi:cytochrome P450
MKAELYPPGPKTRFSATVMLRSVRNPIDLLLDYSKYGDIVHWRFMNDHFYMLNHPDYIKEALTIQDKNFHKAYALQLAKNVLGEGLLTSEGEFHHRQRRLIQPAFHHQQIANYATTMVQYAVRTQNRWKDNQTLDIHKEMMRLTLAIVGKTLFDADLEGEAEAIGRALAEVLEGINRATLIPLGEYLEKIPTPSNRAYEQAQKRLDATIYRIIAERRASGRDHGDLLSMLLKAEEGGGRMTDTQVRDEAMTLFLAGHETTANALTWTFYLLSQNTEDEAKLHEELDRVLQGRVPYFQDVPKLPYTRMVLTESMRLYPPAWVLGREAIRPTRIGGYLIPKGAAVFMSQFVIHHDPRFYPDPYQFKPERWLPEEEKKLPRFAYFPFSGGPRSCVGEQFAWMEGILLLATIAQEWKMRLAPGHRVAMLPRITLRPKYGMQMILTKRKKANP